MKNELLRFFKGSAKGRHKVLKVSAIFLIAIFHDGNSIHALINQGIPRSAKLLKIEADDRAKVFYLLFEDRSFPLVNYISLEHCPEILPELESLPRTGRHD